MIETPTPPKRVRDRPGGYAPRGTSLGFVGLCALATGVPLFGLECAAPVIPNGFDLWLASLPYLVGLALLPLFVLTAGLRSRRYWVICLFYYLGAFLLGAYTLTLPLALAILLGAVPQREAHLYIMSVVGAVLLLALAVPAWFLLRALRLRYWQPGSPPESWEKGDETPPAWALSPTGRNRT